MQFRLNETYLSPALMFENTAVVFLSLTLELSHLKMAQLVSEVAYFHAMTEQNECNALNWDIFYRALKILLYSSYMVIFYFSHIC